MTVTTDEAVNGITIAIKEYIEEVGEVAEESQEKVAKEAVKKLKETSPKNKGNYSKGWRSRKDGKAIVIYNATTPWLTHLLEKGHAIVAHGKHIGRRTAARPHIAPVEKWANNELEAEIRRRLENV